jgi:hypothetical protein
MRQLKNLLASSNVEFFAVSFVSRLGVPGGMPSALTTTLLRELTQATAGQAFFSIDYRDHPEDIVRRLLSHLRTFYTFGFNSESGSTNPGRLTIKCSRPGTKIKQHPTVPILE